MNLNGKTAFITGGSSGIGLSIAGLAMSRGANVAIFARDKKNLSAALKQIELTRISPSQIACAYRLDVSDHMAVPPVISRAVRECGAPFLLVNSAGMGGAFRFEDVSFERFDQTVKINLYGTRNVIAACLPHMKTGGGHIVNISSIAGFLGVFGYTAYSASKFAVIGFSECLRAELRQYSINVSVLCPPDTDTPMMRREDQARPEETRAIAGNAGYVSADFVAESLFRELDTGKFLIVPGIQGKMILLIKRLFPRLPELVMNRTIRKIQSLRTRGTR